MSSHPARLCPLLVQEPHWRDCLANRAEPELAQQMSQAVLSFMKVDIVPEARKQRTGHSRLLWIELPGSQTHDQGMPVSFDPLQCPKEQPIGKETEIPVARD